MNHRMDRRTLVQALGLVGAANLLPWLRPGAASAAGGKGEIPKRIVFFFTGNSQRELWVPKTPAGMAAPTETEFDLSPIHEPLVPHKQDLIFVDGLDYRSLSADRRGFANAHTGKQLHALVCDNAAGGGEGEGGNISIDQLIAKLINTPSPKTFLPSLDMYASCDERPAFNASPSYTGPKQNVPLEPIPQKVYARLFANGIPAVDATPNAADLRRQAMRKTIVDTLTEDFRVLGGRLGRDDRGKLEAHAAAVRDLESRLGLAGAVAGCKAPMLPAMAKGRTGEVYDGRVDAHIRLIQSAFACDLTRVAVLGFQADDPPGDLWGFRPGQYDAPDAHILQHSFALKQYTNNPEARACMTRYYQLQSKYFGKLIDMLKAIPERDGKTLFDHTIVFWCHQLAEGWHSSDRMPYVLATGRAGGIFRTGRWVKYDRPKNIGLPHNNLMVSLANAMGFPITTFGNPNVCTGALDRLT